MTDPDTDAPGRPDPPDQHTAGGRRPAWRSPVVLVAAFALVVVVGVLLVGGLAGTEEDETAEDGTEEGTDGTVQEELVDEFSGSEDDSTATFTVQGEWEVRWETEGDAFQVNLVDEDGEELQTVVDHEGQGGGSNYLTRDGTYSLDVTADGDWSIRVFERTE